MRHLTKLYDMQYGNLTLALSIQFWQIIDYVPCDLKRIISKRFLVSNSNFWILFTFYWNTDFNEFRCVRKFSCRGWSVIHYWRSWTLAHPTQCRFILDHLYYWTCIVLVLPILILALEDVTQRAIAWVYISVLSSKKNITFGNIWLFLCQIMHRNYLPPLRLF